MRERADFVALGFASTHDALSAEAAMRAAGLTVLPIPTPKGLGELCGIALRIPPSSIQAAEDALAAAGIGIAGSVSFEDWV